MFKLKRKVLLVIIPLFFIILLSMSLPADIIYINDSSFIYDGYVVRVNATGRVRNATAPFSFVGNNPFGGLFGEAGNISTFVQFNTSSLSDSIEINYVLLNFTNYIYLPHQNISISRFNNSQINSTNYPDNIDGNDALYNNISTGYNNLGYYIANITYINTTATWSLNLGSNAIIDLKSQLVNDFFALGIVGDNKGFLVLNTSEGGISVRPTLIINYNSTACIPPVSGDWVINQTCYIFNKSYRVPANLLMQDKGWLLLNQSLLNFNVTTEQRIKIYPGGRVQLYNGSRIK